MKANNYNKKNIIVNDDNIKKYVKDGYKLTNMDSLHNFILKGFSLCKQLNFNIFGINPVDNPYFLTPANNPINKSHISTDLK